MNKANTYPSTRQLVLISLITAITCILAPFSIPIPISPVPVSLTNLVLYISCYLLGYKGATISYLMYVLLGVAGLPIFSGFAGGIGKIAGPTGGYLVGFLFLTVIGGFFIEKWPSRRSAAIGGMILGTLVTYGFGTLWLSHLLDLTFIQGLAVGVFPYLIFDLIKILLASVFGVTLRNRVLQHSAVS